MRILPGLLLVIALAPSPRASGEDVPSGIAGFTDLGETVARTLVDPIAQSACTYLDLDNNITFSYGESSQHNMVDARQWIRERGVDVMCESRDPVKGLVIYDMAIHETRESIDEPREFDTVSKQLESIEPERMNFISPKELPRTYLFRTREGAVGVLEIGEKLDEPAGYRLRFRPIPKLPPPIPLSALQDQLGKDQRRLQLLQLNHSEPALLAEMRRRIKLLTDLQQITRNERVQKLASMETALAVRRYQLEGLKRTLPADTTQVVALQRGTDAMAKALEVEFAKYRMPKLKGMTPVTLLPVRPAASQPAGAGN